MEFFIVASVLPITRNPIALLSLGKFVIVKVKFKNTILLVFLSFIVGGCQKEGLGGKAVISGYVYENITDRNGLVVENIPAVNEDVFITYGDKTFYQDDVTTDDEGYYEFSFLRKGEYNVFVYGDCLDCNSGRESLNHKISIDTKTKNSSDHDFAIMKLVDYDDGSSSIKGRLIAQQYLGNTLFGDPYPSQENEVYIVYGNDDVYFDRMDTGVDGWFEFTKLIKGEYTLYAFSECASCTNYKDTVQLSVIISENNSYVTLSDMKIQKR